MINEKLAAGKRRRKRRKPSKKQPLSVPSTQLHDFKAPGHKAKENTIIPLISWSYAASPLNLLFSFHSDLKLPTFFQTTSLPNCSSFKSFDFADGTADCQNLDERSSQNMVDLEMEGGGGGSSHETLKDNTCFSQFRNGSNPWMARYVYGLMFLVATLLAWSVRDYAGSALTEMERLKGCQGAMDCLGAEGVLRVSFGCFTFYFTMFLSTTGTSKLQEPRDSWHSGWWSAKVLLWIGFIVVSFLLPSEFIQLYGDIAHFGAGVFLLIQLISIISFITWLDRCCRSKKKADKCQIHVTLLATTAYVVCLMGIILMYIWYAPASSCLLNIFFITWTLVLLQLMTSVSLHPNVKAGILTPGLMGLYVVFMCWCAIRSEPDGKCIRNPETSTKTNWLTIISFVVAVLAMVIATFSTGIDSKCFQFTKKETQDEDDVPYGYGFFHFVFATGAMYFAMLLIGWNSHHAMRKWTIDVGWTSTWVRIVNEWLAVCVYLWILVAHIVWSGKQGAEST